MSLKRIYYCTATGIFSNLSKPAAACVKCPQDFQQVQRTTDNYPRIDLKGPDHRAKTVLETTNTSTAAAEFTMTEASKSQDEKEKGIKVICAGLGRTGTMSLTDALTILGYKSYHYVDFGHINDWAEWSQGLKTEDEIIDLIVDSGYDAVLENPTSDIYEAILKRYPSAKVVLTVRDTPQSFVKSWKLLFDTMVVTEQKFSWTFPSFLGYIPMFANLKSIRRKMGTTHLGLNDGDLTHNWRDRPDADEWLALQYQRHNQHIIDHVPKDQLLVFNVKEGWEPLCKFLGHPIPLQGDENNDEEVQTVQPFPHSKVNTAESLQKLQTNFKMVVYGWLPTLVVIALGTAFYCSKNRSSSGKQPVTKIRLD